MGWGWLSQTRPIPRSPDGDKKWWGNYESDAQAQLSITLSILRVTWFDNDDDTGRIIQIPLSSTALLIRKNRPHHSSWTLPSSIFHLSRSALLSHPPLLRLWGSPTSFYFSVLLFGPDHPAQSHFCGYFSTTVDSFWWVVKLSGEWSIITHKCNIVEI